MPPPRNLPIFLLSFFFFFFLLPTIISSPTKYKTLLLTPLRLPPPIKNPISDSKSPSQTSLLLPLAHRDAFLLPSNHTTPTHLFLLRLLRDAARVSHIHQTLLSSNHSPNSFTSPVISGLPQGSGEYFTRLSIGTPPRPSLLVLDTGSDIVWLQCSPCRRCYTQSDPIFNPRLSHSFSPIPCSSQLCRRLDVSGCNTPHNSCLYQVSYGDGSLTTGQFATETLTFASGVRVPRVALGCGHDNEGLFVAAAGLLGLGRGSLSFVSQAGRQFNRRFSYCLVDRTSSKSKSKSKSASSVVFGDAAMPKGASGAFTAMLRNPKMDTFYYVEVIGLSVGGARVRGAELRLDMRTGRGGVIVDSGTSVTRLERTAYVALRDAFKEGAAEELGLRAISGGFSLFDTCYDLAGKKEVKVPTVVMHLAGTDSDLDLPPENYLIPVDTKGTFCFAFAGTDSGVSIIGNIQQQGFRVVFDGVAGRVGFLPRGC